MDPTDPSEPSDAVPRMPLDLAAMRTQGPDLTPKFAFRLFVAGEEARHQVTIRALRQLCDRHLSGGYELTVIDVLRRPEAADRDRVLATPTLLRVAPGPACRIVGDICDERVLLTEMGLCESSP